MLKHTVGFIGAGQMARALSRGFLRAGLLASDHLIAFDPVPETLQQFCTECSGARSAASNSIVAQEADILLLAVKPQNLQAVSKELSGRVAGKLIVSILAGIPLA